MTIEYTWQFGVFEKAPLQGGLADVVKVIHWSLQAMDGEYVASLYGAAQMAEPDPDNFVAFGDITKQWAIDAVSGVVDIAAMELSLANEIERQKSPPVVSVAPPFTN